MEVIIDEKSRIVEIWLSHADQNNDTITTKLSSLYKEYPRHIWTVAVYRSGEKDLHTLTAALVRENKGVTRNGPHQEFCEILALGE